MTPMVHKHKAPSVSEGPSADFIKGHIQQNQKAAQVKKRVQEKDRGQPPRAKIQRPENHREQ